MSLIKVNEWKTVKTLLSFLSAETLSLVGESGEYLGQDGYLEEEELISGEDVLSDVTINGNRPQMKRRRLYRAPRERQRGGSNKKPRVYFDC